MSWGLDRVTVAYGHRRALDQVTFAVEPGTIVALIGGDGSGKSTALRALAGAVPVAGGSVRRPPARQIGYVSEGPGIYRDLTVMENLEFAGRAYGLAGERLDRAREDLLRRMGLETARDRLAARLSGGMRQKLGLAAALLHRPDLLVLDEPTTGVDPVSRAELWRLVALAAAGGRAVVLSTTYVEEAERVARVVLLSEGRVLLEGPPGDLIRRIEGSILATPEPVPGAWRAPEGWRVRAGPGRRPRRARPVPPRLEDAVVLAELEAAA